MTVERRFAAQCPAIHHTLEFVLGGNHGLAKGRGQLLERGAVERMHRKVDAEALFGTIHEFLAEGCADVDVRQAFAVANDRSHAENAERLSPGLDADDRLASLDSFDNRAPAAGYIVTENLGFVNTVKRSRRRHLEGNQRDTLRLQCLVGVAEQGRQLIATTPGDGLADRRQRGDHRTYRERRGLRSRRPQ